MQYTAKMYAANDSKTTNMRRNLTQFFIRKAHTRTHTDTGLIITDYYFWPSQTSTNDDVLNGIHYYISYQCGIEFGSIV